MARVIRSEKLGSSLTTRIFMNFRWSASPVVRLRTESQPGDACHEQVACRIAPATGSENGTPVVSRTDWTLTVPSGTTLEESDIAVIGGVVYELASIATPRSHETCIRVVCVMRGDQKTPTVVAP